MSRPRNSWTSRHSSWLGSSRWTLSFSSFFCCAYRAFIRADGRPPETLQWGEIGTDRTRRVLGLPHDN
jgi:hypothetical protein